MVVRRSHADYHGWAAALGFWSLCFLAYCWCIGDWAGSAAVEIGDHFVLESSHAGRASTNVIILKKSAAVFTQATAG
jgi:hypothetical protein